MGLAMVYGIINNHGGSIQVKSKLDAGTTFALNLAPTGHPKRSAPAPMPKEAVSGTGLILVVDDEEVVREVAAGFLDYAGYKVLTACDGEVALEIYRERGSDIDLVVLEMVVRRMGFVPKPYEMNELTGAVSKALAR